MAGSFVEDPAFFMSGGCLRRPSAAPGYRLFPAESESGCGGHHFMKCAAALIVHAGEGMRHSASVCHDLYVSVTALRTVRNGKALCRLAVCVTGAARVICRGSRGCFKEKETAVPFCCLLFVIERTRQAVRRSVFFRPKAC